MLRIADIVTNSCNTVYIIVIDVVFVGITWNISALEL